MYPHPIKNEKDRLELQQELSQMYHGHIEVRSDVSAYRGIIDVDESKSDPIAWGYYRAFVDHMNRLSQAGSATN